MVEFNDKFANPEREWFRTIALADSGGGTITRTLLTEESGFRFSDHACTEAVDLTLPVCALGLHYRFDVQGSGLWRILSDSGDLIPCDGITLDNRDIDKQGTYLRLEAHGESDWIELAGREHGWVILGGNGLWTLMYDPPT